MVIELVGALSLPVWLCVEEVMRLRGEQPLRAQASEPVPAMKPAGAGLVRARNPA